MFHTKAALKEKPKMPSGTEKIHSKMAGVDATTSVIILDVNGLTLPLKGQRLLG